MLQVAGLARYSTPFKALRLYSTTPPMSESFKVLPLNRSEHKTNRTLLHIKDAHTVADGSTVTVRGHLHSVRGKGNICFMILRQGMSSIQAVVQKSEPEIPKAALSFVASINKESVVELEGVIKATSSPIESTTQVNVEIAAKKVFLVSEAAPSLPFQLEDASRSAQIMSNQANNIKEIESKLKNLQTTDPTNSQVAELQKRRAEAQKYAEVGLDIRLNNRILDLRTMTNQAIFRVQAGVSRMFREYLETRGFVEIHTPKMLPSASEGGSNVFKLGYFGGEAFLAQSPQLHKQMAVMGGMERVYEIGAVYRAENSNTHRHLTEFTGLDIEMAFSEHYHEVLEVLEGIIKSILTRLESEFSKELATIRLQFPSVPAVIPASIPRLQFREAVAILREKGIQMEELEDISMAQEKQLGQIVKEKFNSDLFILEKYPKKARAFYTMIDAVDPNYTNSYDFFLRGEEILSGGQRISDPALLSQRAQECGISLEKIANYVNAFKYGAVPHGGGGFGLERIVFLYLGLNNIRNASLFPRDPERLAP